MELYPDVNALAEASEDEILRAWEGLGYYRRARNLQAAAVAVVERHGGVFPESTEDILALPGVGKYTAGAVASFAYGRSEPLVDANVTRVFARQFDFRDRVDSTKGQKQLWNWASDLVSHASDGRAYNSALMELGQTHCKNGEPSCLVCPVRSFCAAENPASLPVKAQRRKTVEVEEHALFARREGAVLLEQGGEGRREGLWKLPELSEGEAADKNEVLKSKYGITHHRVTLRVYEAEADYSPRKESKIKWVKEDELEDFALASPYRKALGKLLG